MPLTRSPVMSRNITASAVVSATPSAFFGLSIRETGGTNPVTVKVYDNPSAASGTILFTRRLAANECFDAFYPAEDAMGGAQALNGLYVEVTGTGTLEGCIRWGG